ncbi:MAG: hypothetical protein HEP71_31370 [Roseivirga sp.]|nr:hypothetical protein [Roseivirga sp.]
MFLRKLFKIGDKARWLVLELLVVFVGVYLAFLFQGYSENNKIVKEREKVFASLKSELEFFRVQMPGRSGYTLNRWKEAKAFERKGEYRDFSYWRFLEPQYGYQVVEYAINIENSDIIDFELYDKLQSLYATIRRLEHAERLMMEMAQRYLSIPKSLPESDRGVILRHADNFQNFRRLLEYIEHRAQNQQDVADRSKDCLDIINARMNADTRRKIEVDLIKSQLGLFDNPEDAVERVRAVFPGFTQDEILKLYNEFSSK